MGGVSLPGYGCCKILDATFMSHASVISSLRSVYGISIRG